MSLYDVSSVKDLADKALKSSGVEDARVVYQEHLFDWTDHYNENFANDAESQEAIAARRNIALLWIEYCNQEKSSKQFKKCVQAYEDALKDPISSKCVELYLSYADYYSERAKYSNAQKAFIRGLCAGLTTADTDILWSHFLSFMHEINKSTSLTVEDLYEAAKNQLKGIEGTLVGPSENYLANVTDKAQLLPARASGEAESKVESDADRPNSIATVSDTTTEANRDSMEDFIAALATNKDFKTLPRFSPPSSPLYETDTETDIYSSIPQVENSDGNSAAFSDELDDISGLTPEVLIKAYSHRPGLLFCALDQEPMLLGLGGLSPDDRAQLEKVLGVPLNTLSSQDVGSLATTYLNLLEGMWISQALKERQFDHWFAALRNNHVTEEASLSSMIATAKLTNNPDAVIKAETDMKRFKSRCLVQRELLHAIVNRILINLLLDQQRTLLAAGIPSFTPEVIRKLENALANARSMSHPGHVNAFETEPLLEALLQRQRTVVGALLSVRLSYLRQANPQASSRSDGGWRISSVDCDISGDWSKDPGRTKRRLNENYSHIVDHDRPIAQIAPTLSVPILPALSSLHSQPLTAQLLRVQTAVVAGRQAVAGKGPQHPLFYNPPVNPQSSHVRRRTQDLASTNQLPVDFVPNIADFTSGGRGRPRR